MPNEMQIKQNTIQAVRTIRRKFEVVGGKFSSPDEKPMLIATCVEHANKELSSWEKRCGAIDRVVLAFIKKEINAAGVKFSEIEEEDAIEVSAEDGEQDEKRTPIESLSLSPGATKVLRDAGMETLEALAEYADSRGDFTGILGIGVATSSKILGLISEGQDDEQGEEADEA